MSERLLNKLEMCCSYFNHLECRFILNGGDLLIWSNISGLLTTSYGKNTFKAARGYLKKFFWILRKVSTLSKTYKWTIGNYFKGLWCSFVCIKVNFLFKEVGYFLNRSRVVRCNIIYSQISFDFRPMLDFRTYLF